MRQSAAALATKAKEASKRTSDTLWLQFKAVLSGRAFLAVLGISTGSIATIILNQHIANPNSQVNRAGSDVRARVHEAADAVREWIESLIPKPTISSIQHDPRPSIQPGSVQGYAAQWLADWCEQPDRSTLAVALGGSPLLDWLVDTATQPVYTSDVRVLNDQQLDEGQLHGADKDMRGFVSSGSRWDSDCSAAEQQQAQRALILLLQSDNTAAHLVSRPGAVPRLIKHCVKLQKQRSLDHGNAADPMFSALEQDATRLYEALQHRAYAGLGSRSMHAMRNDADADVIMHRSDQGRDGYEDDLSVAHMMHSILGGGADLSSGTGLTSSTAAYEGPTANARDMEQVLHMMLNGLSDHRRPPTGTATELSGGVVHEATKDVLALQDQQPDGQHVTGHTDDDTLPAAQDLSLQAHCAAWLSSWAESGLDNRQVLQGLDVASAVEVVASRVSGRSATREACDLQLQLARLISAIAGPCVLPGGHEGSISKLLQPVLYITADAVVDRDSRRMVAALATAKQLLKAGGEFAAAEAARKPLLPLLQKILQETSSTDVRTSAVKVLAAMAQHPTSFAAGTTQVPAASKTSAGGTAAVVTAADQVVSYWRTWLLSQITKDDESPAHAALRQECCKALTGLSQLPGLAGLQVTHHWLAALLDSLGSRVWPYNAVVYTGPQQETIASPARAVGPGATGASPNTAASTFRRFFTWRPAAPASQPEASTAQTKQTGVQADGDTGTVVSGVAEGGQAVDVRDLLDAVPVLPGHVRSVAAALRDASNAVVEDYEAPSDFDPSGSGTPGPLARQFYRQVVRAIDMIVVEKQVCQALEVLNALVAADPAKQRWLLSVGVIPLMYQLAHPPESVPSPIAAFAAAQALARDTKNSKSDQHGNGPAGTTGQSKQQTWGAWAYNMLPAVPWRGKPAADATKSVAGATTTSADTPNASEVSHSTDSLTHKQVESLQKTESVTMDAEVPSSAGVAGDAAAGDAGAAAAGSSRQDAAATADVYHDHDGPAHLCLRRQVARLLALLAVQPGARQDISSEDWHKWLSHASSDQDCRLSSHATKALLNLEAFRARSRKSVDKARSSTQDVASSLASVISNTLTASAGASSGLGKETAPVYMDMIHLLNPDSQRLWVLARKGMRPHSSQLLDKTQPTAPEPTMTLNDSNSGSSSSGIVDGSDSRKAAEQAVAGRTGTVAENERAIPANKSTSPQAMLAVSSRSLSPSSPGMGVAGGAAMMMQAQDGPAVLYTALAGGVLGAWDTARSALSTLSTAAAGALTTTSLVSSSVTGTSHSLSSTHPDVQQPSELTDSVTSSTLSTAASSADEEVLKPVRGKLHSKDRDGSDTSCSLLTRHQQEDLGDDEGPLVDVVFVHGIRGGPFITWRKPGSTIKGKNAFQRSAAYLTRSHVWPSDWLAQECPQIRLLTVEYLAPVTGWEGESLPLEATVQRVLGQLEAAGVGQRPVVWVAHSMGGLLVKEILMHSLQQQQQQPTPRSAFQQLRLAHSQQHQQQQQGSLAANTKGIVFFATPHFGSEFAAMGWKLRHLPIASPAPALAKLTPGPHLVELNEALRHLHDKQGVKVVSFIEGQATQLSPVLPKILVVPEASAWPGFGTRIMLEADNHISLCKPPDTQSTAYVIVRDMVATAVGMQADVLKTKEQERSGYADAVAQAAATG